MNASRKWKFLPTKYAPTLGGPRKQANKHKHKLKGDGKKSPVCSYCKKKGHKADVCWHSNKSECQVSHVQERTFFITTS